MALELDTTGTHQDTGRGSPPTAPRSASGTTSPVAVGYEEGRNALRPRGRATVVGSAGATEPAWDAVFTPALVSRMKRHSTESLDQALTAAAAGTYRTRDGSRSQHPTIATSAGNVASTQRKRGVYVANTYQNHPFAPTLNTKPDAQGMHDVLSARGYESSGIEVDRTAAEMKASFDGAVSGSDVGDSVVLFFAGHGLPKGLLGARIDRETVRGLKKVPTREDSGARGLILDDGPGPTNTPAPPMLELIPNDLLDSGTLGGLVAAGVSRGVNVTLISDSCHSGVLAENERNRELNGANAAAPAAPGGSAVREAALLGRRIHSMKQVIYSELRPPASPATSAAPAQPATNRGLILLENEGTVLESWGLVVLPTLVECVASLRSLSHQPVPPPPQVVSVPDIAIALDYIDDLTNQVLRFIDSQAQPHVR